jgi:hypothetical protein
VVLFCTKNSSSEREAAAVHLVSASVDAKSQKRWRIVAGTNEVEEVLFALFDVDFVFFFVVVVPDAPPIIILIIYREHATTPTKARFLCARGILERQSVVFFQRERKCLSTLKNQSLVVVSDPFSHHEKVAHPFIRQSGPPLGNPTVCRKTNKFFFFAS